MAIEFKPLFRLKGHRDSLYALSDDGKGGLLSAGGDGLIARWQLGGNSDATLLVQVPATVYALLRLDSLLLIGTREGGLHLVDLEKGEEIKLFRWNQQPVFSLLACAGGWISTHGDGSVHRWQYEAGQAQIMASYKASEAAVRCITALGENFALGYSDHKIRMVNSDLQEIGQLEGHTNSVFSLLGLQNGKYLLSGGRDALLKVWSIADEKCLASITAHLYTINHLIHLPEAGLIASASRDKCIKLWDSQSISLQKVVDYNKFPGLAHSHSVNRLWWDAASQRLYSAGDDRLVIAYAITFN